MPPTPAESFAWRAAVLTPWPPLYVLACWWRPPGYTVVEWLTPGRALGVVWLGRS